MLLRSFTWISAALFLSRVCAKPTSCRFKRRLVEICHSLLMSMGGAFPLRCIDDTVLVPFPKMAFEYNTSQQAGAIRKSVYVTLKHIYSVFDNDEVPDQWNGHQKFEDFLNILFRQTEENQCVLNTKIESLDNFLNREIVLRLYFEKLTAVLKEKGFQYCAWEFVRHEIQRIFLFILKTDFDSRLPSQG